MLICSIIWLGNPRQRAPRQQQNGQRILHPPWRLRMRARRKRG
ncbi:DNA-binding protein [Escherichia coli]|nr:DNA-binding protein [Escherichia coli]TDE75701.1 DNA-binding protein [Escherichia sp. KCJ4928]EEV5626350.1 DNA-binding protein [Escherichia coli]EFA5437814.1 DNA-binding protein [Escherichia coli]EFB1322721.1 DNA-binding protein [Escherichia coli]